MIASPSTLRPHEADTVVACYSVFDRVFPKCGFVDLTEGMYHGDRNLGFSQAQCNQHEYLLDQANCHARSKLLDVGCGYGTLMERARERGAEATGITLSPEQAQSCRRRGLDVRVLDYRAMGPEWNETFDAAVANGSAEHFVQAEDKVTRRDDAIYEHFFETMYRVLAPGRSARLVTTIIHLVRDIDPECLVHSPFLTPIGSDTFHYSMLAHSFGGSYPALGQLQRCAAPHFDLIDEVDGTEDYRLTSEAWLADVRKVLKTRVGMRILASSLSTLLSHPLQLPLMWYCMLVSESWNWQFRLPDPPTRLLRQTWQRRD